jgi:hypothetical protein
MHDLNLPRAYQTVYVCGAFGIGGDRDHDREALRHFRDHLRPGGALVMDTRLPHRDARNWRYWSRVAGAHDRPSPVAGAGRPGDTPSQ